MTVLRHISAIIAQGQEVDALAHGRRFGYERDFIEGKLGSVSLARMLPDQEASDLCVAAARKLEADGFDAADVGAIWNRNAERRSRHDRHAARSAGFRVPHDAR